jgi:lipopolysaccharide export system permease protein
VNLIDRYVLRLFVKTLFYGLISFLGVFILVDLVDHIDDFIDDEASILSILKFYLYIAPAYLDYSLPISMMLASMFTMGVLGKSREYTAILSSGTSLARMCRVLILFGIIMTGLSIAWREGVVAETNRRHHEVKEFEIEGRARDRLKARRNFTHVDEMGRVYLVSRFRPRPPTLEWVSIQTFTDSTLVQRLDARRAVWDNDHWRLENGSRRDFDAAGTETLTAFASMKLEGTTEPPRNFSDQRIEPEDMNWAQLRDFANWVERTGGDPTPYRAEMAHKLSFPVINLIVVLLGLAIGASRQRNTLWAGFGATIAAAFGYYLLTDFGLELGRSGLIPPLISAWSGNVLYGVVAGVMFWRANH